MISREVLVGVLRSHSQRRNVRDLHTQCLCGWTADRIPGVGQHVQHQAAMVLDAIERLRSKRITYADDLSADVLWSVQKDAVSNDGGHTCCMCPQQEPPLPCCNQGHGEDAVSNEWPYEETLDSDERDDR